MFKNHLEMIGRNETPSKKAKFWQSYIRSLKGSEDIRAHDSPKVRSYRPYSAYTDMTPPSIKAIIDDAQTPHDRIASHGYRYQPVMRETYGYSPRAIYDHHYPRHVHSASYDVDKAWSDHLKRMAEIERRYPSRYGLYLKDKPNAQVPLEYEPEDKPLFSERGRASSVPPLRPFDRASSVPRPFERAGSVLPPSLRASSLEPLDNLFSLPIYYAGSGPRRNQLRNLLNPSHALPYSAITRDPFWWDVDDLRPFRPRLARSSSPSYLRDSFLSPVKRQYLWPRHPMRPFAHLY